MYLRGIYKWACVLIIFSFEHLLRGWNPFLLLQVVGSSLVDWCKSCRDVITRSKLWAPDKSKTCWKILPPFQDIGTMLKKKYHNAVPVLFVGNRLMEKVGDNMRAIQNNDTKLVYLDPSSNGCLRDDTMTSPNNEMFKTKSCKSVSRYKPNCHFFSALCSYFGMRQETVTERVRKTRRRRFCFEGYRRRRTFHTTTTTTCHSKPQGVKAI